MSRFVCYVCGRSFEAEKQASMGMTNIMALPCSIRCLCRHLRRDTGKINTSIIHRYAEKVSNIPGEDERFYSSRLNTLFRGQAELMFAELLVLRHKRQMAYEPYWLDILGNGRKAYVPDFFDIDSQVFLEVKGLWHPGAKKKTLKAAELLGRDKLLILPMYLFAELKEAWEGMRWMEAL